MAAMDRLMASLRQSRPSELAGLRVVKVADYQESVQEDVVSGARSPSTCPSPMSSPSAWGGARASSSALPAPEPKGQGLCYRHRRRSGRSRGDGRAAPGSGGRPAQGISSRIAEARVAGGPYALLLLAPADRGQRLYSRIP